jgi:hypothetical protein
VSGLSWYEHLAGRWHVRQLRARGRAEFTGVLDREVVVPADSEGRPGYRLTTAGASHTVRGYSGFGRTNDFFLGVGHRSLLIGSCNGRSGDDDLVLRATESVESAVRTRAEFGVSCLEEPTESRMAGERAVVYTLAIASGARAGTTVTDTLFDHEGWCFTVGAFLAPSDGVEAVQMKDAILSSWTWLPRTP